MRLPPKEIYILSLTDDKTDLHSEAETETGAQTEIDFPEVADADVDQSPQVEILLDELGHGDRKWLLFDFVCREPHFLEEAGAGYPISMIELLSIDDQGHRSQRAAMKEVEETKSLEVGEPVLSGDVIRGDRKGKEKGKGKGKEQCPPVEGDEESNPHGDKIQEDYYEEMSAIEMEIGTKSKTRDLRPICVPRVEWLITFAQIDAIPASNRDDFLLSLCLMSEPHAAALVGMYTRLQKAERIQDTYKTDGDATTPSSARQSYTAFDEDAETSLAKMNAAKAAMVTKYDKDGLEWYRVDDHHQDDFVHEISKTEVYAHLHDDQYMYVDSSSSSSTRGPDEMISRQMAVFMIETKFISLIDTIVRVDYKAFPDRYRALRILDLLSLAKTVARTPKGLRRSIDDVVDALVKGILELWECLDEIEREWLKVQRTEVWPKERSGFVWDVETVRAGLETVDLHGKWALVESAIGS